MKTIILKLNVSESEYQYIEELANKADYSIESYLEEIIGEELSLTGEEE